MGSAAKLYKHIACLRSHFEKIMMTEKTVGTGKRREEEAWLKHTEESPSLSQNQLKSHSGQ